MGFQYALRQKMEAVGGRGAKKTQNDGNIVKIKNTHTHTHSHEAVDEN